MLKIDNSLIIEDGKLLNAVTGSPDVPTVPVINGIRIGDLYWATEDLKYDDGLGGITVVRDVVSEGVNLGDVYLYTFEAARRVVPKIQQGWRFATELDMISLIPIFGSTTLCTALKSTSGWTDGANGTNASGLNMKPCGFLNYAGVHADVGSKWGTIMAPSTFRDVYFIQYSNTGLPAGKLGLNEYGGTIRLVKDV